MERKPQRVTAPAPRPVELPVPSPHPPTHRCLLCAGTGKTATFAIGILQQLEVGLRRCQALVLAPTRELAQVRLCRTVRAAPAHSCPVCSK